MAALDDELGLPAYEYAPGAITGATPTTVSALGGDDEQPVAPAEYTGPSAAALLADPTVQRRLQSPRIPEFARQRVAELIRQKQEAPPDYQAMMNDPAAMERELQGAVPMYYPSEPKKVTPEEPGWIDILGRGLMRGTEDLKQSKEVTEGKKPTESKTPPAEYEQTLELADFGSPMKLLEKTVFGLARSYPSVALGIAGSLAGGAIGGAVTAPTGPGAAIGATVGTIVGGAAGMGLGAAFQELGPAYAAELQATPDDVDGAWDRALVTVGKTGVVNAASMALLGAGKPLSNALKGLWTKSVAGAPAPVAGLPTRIGVQAVGQTVAPVGGEVAANAIEGKPLTTNLDPAAAGSIVNVAGDLAAQLGGRALRGAGRRIVGRGKPGVDADQDAALTAEQGTLPLEGGAGVRPAQGDLTQPARNWGGMELPEQTGGPTIRPGEAPGPAGRRYDVPPEEPIPARQPPGSAPRPVPPDIEAALVPDAAQMRLPDILGPGRQPLGDQLYTPRPPGPEQGELPLGGGPPSGMPPSPAPPRVGPVGGPQLELPVGETQLPLPLRAPENVPRPGPAQPELPGIGRPQARPGEQPELPGIAEPGGGIDRMAPGEAARSPIGAVEQPIEPPPSTRGLVGPSPGALTAEGWTTERDHTGPGYVVKNDAGNVIAVGDTAAQAVEFARARSPEQVRATTGTDAGTDVTKRGGVTEEVQTEKAKAAERGTERAPPAGGPSARVGGDAVPEPLSEQTFKLPKTGHVLTGRQNIGTVDPARPFVLSWTRNLLDAQGRPVRGVSHKFDYADEASARTDLEAVRAAGGKNAMLREFVDGTAREIDKPLTKAEQRKATAQEKVAAVKAKAAEKLHTETGSKPAAKTETVTKSPDTEKVAPEVGTITKTGAFTMGEGEPPPARRAQPTTSTETEMSRSAREESEGMPRVARVGGEYVTARELPTREFSLPAGESKARHAWRLVTGLVKGDVDLARAIELYGEKLPGTRGRPRNFSDLTKVVREALRQAEDPAIEVGLRAKMATMKAGTKAYGDIDARVDMLESARLNKEKLAGVLTELEAIDRGGDAADAVKSIQKSFNEIIATAKRRTMTRMAHDPEVNAPILSLLDGDPKGLHTYLDAIINNPRAQRMTPEFVELAKVLRRILPDIDVRHVPRDNLDEVGGYISTRDVIELNRAGLAHHNAGVMTLLHEAVHGATKKYVDHLFNALESTLSPRSLAHKRALTAMQKELQRVFDERRLSDVEADRLGYSLTTYWGVPHEMITQILSDTHVMNVLHSVRASAEFRAALDSVGMGGSRTTSLWDGFKRIVRSIFGVRERLDSVMDLILRPATEITEVGARFREGVDVRKTVKNNADVIDSAPDERTNLSLKRIRDAVTNTTEPGWRLALKGAMHGATMNAIHDAIKPYIPSVAAHRDALEAVGRATYNERVRPVTTYAADGRAIVEAHSDKTDRLYHEMQKGGAPSKDMQELATEIQYSETSLLRPGDNAHVNPKILEDQLGRWNALPPAIRQTYKEMIELYADHDRVAREARIRQFSENAFPGFTRAQHNDVVDHMKTRAGIEDILANTDRSALAVRMGPRFANSKELLTILAESERDHGFTRGDHVPLARYGEYVVSAGVVTDKPNYVVKMFETPAAARNFQAELAATRNDVSQVFKKTDDSFVNNIGIDRALGTFDAAMTRAGIGDAQKQVLRDIYAGNLIQQGMRTATHTMRRERILGASTDQARNLINDYISHTTRVGHAQHQGEVIRTWFQMDKEAREYRRTPGAHIGVTAMTRDGVQELRNHMTSADGDNSADGMGRSVRGLTTLAVVDTLVRPAHLVFQVAGTHIAATSMLGGRHGIVQSHFAVNKAIAQLTGTAFGVAGRGMMAAFGRDLKAANWNVSEVYRDRLIRAKYDPKIVNAFIDEMNRSNLIEQTKIREMQRMAGPRGWSDIPVLGRALDMFSAAEHAVDSALRVATGWAGLQLELRKNPGRVDDAIAYGKQIARDAQPDWNFYNKSSAATVQGWFGRLAPIITQYKQFGLHMYGVQGNLILNSIRDPASHKEALRSLALLQGQHALLYGGIGASLFGSLPVMFGMGMYDLLSGDDRPHTAQEAQMRARNWVADMTKSKTLAAMFDRGVPMSFGADVHNSLSFVNPLGVPAPRSYDKEGMLNFMVQAMTGASGDTAVGLTDAALKILRGDWRGENWLKLAPRAIEDPLTAAFMWPTEGLKTAQGDRTILRPQDFSTKDLILKGVGVIPKVVSDARQARTTMDLQQKVVQDAHDHILKRLVLAKGDNERKKVLAEVERYNKVTPLNDRITGQQIQRRFRDQAMANAQPNLYGMNIPKRDTLAAQELTRSLRP